MDIGMFWDIIETVRASAGPGGGSSALPPGQRRAGTRSARGPWLKASEPGGRHPGRRGPGRARRRASRAHISTASRGADSR